MKREAKNSFSSQDTLKVGNQEVQIYRLSALEQAGKTTLSTLPFSIRILLENVLRNEDGRLVTEDDVLGLASYDATNVAQRELPYLPARVVMQDFTGVPAVVDLAALRSFFIDVADRHREAPSQGRSRCLLISATPPWRPHKLL